MSAEMSLEKMKSRLTPYSRPSRTREPKAPSVSLNAPPYTRRPSSPPVPCGKYCETPKLSHIAHKDEKERMLRAIAIARVSARRRALRTATQADQTSRTGTSQVLTPIQCSVQ